jgi:hypothetical protein
MMPAAVAGLGASSREPRVAPTASKASGA